MDQDGSSQPEVLLRDKPRETEAARIFTWGQTKTAAIFTWRQIKINQNSQNFYSETDLNRPKQCGYLLGDSLNVFLETGKTDQDSHNLYLKIKD